MRSLTRVASCLAAAGVVLGPVAMAQQPPTLAPAVRQFVSVDSPVVALTHVRLMDGTGAPPRDDQTIVFDHGRITVVGASIRVAPPPGAYVMNLDGHTVIPGIVGLHDHMYYGSTAGGAMRPMLFSYPKLFLSAGVTTIRTTGSVDSYQELNIRKAILDGLTAGPEIVVTGPYLQGPGVGPGAMHALSGEDDARRMVRYWAEEGVTWFKAYTQISRAELAAAIDEAHKHGVKVTAHLCSVGFREAVAAGIDALEHGLLTNSEYFPGKQADACPGVSDSAEYGALDIASPDVQRTIREMVQHHVAMTSTLDVFELSAPSRVPFDQRVIDALHPDARPAVLAFYERGKTAKDSAFRSVFKKAMAFDRAFYLAGGLLAAGSDPCCITSMAGFGDQRNYELLIEAGFKPEEAIKVMTLNGATALGFGSRLGSIEVGKQADLVVLRGDAVRTPGAIREVVTVFRQGVGYDPSKLFAAVKGLIGER